jgi:hypothetical protein
MTLITLIYTDQKKLTADCADERGSEGKNLTPDNMDLPDQKVIEPF